ncbi:class II fructose-bisphosphate aldolase [bacterium]|nr:class II fructose-bisphosphate aldolase [bacterium]
MSNKASNLFSMTPLLKAAELSSLDGKPAAIGAFNVNFYTQALGIIEGLKKAGGPGIIQASKGANKFQGGAEHIKAMVLQAMQDCQCTIPVALHLDHGNSEAASACIENGFSSVMIDASHSPLEENIQATLEIVKKAAPKGVSVEGEYGMLAGVEEDIIHETTTYANPMLVPYFFDETGADALAIAYGTSHGPNKGQNLSGLAIHIVDQSYKGLKAYGQNEKHFLVSHGSSTVPQDLVAEINQYGGNLKAARGVPMEKIKEAIASGMRKVNIDTDLRLGITATFRKYFIDNPGIENDSPNVLAPIKKVLDENPGTIDPRDYLKVIDIKLLRKDPAGTDLEDVMALIKPRITAHVAMLVKEFGSAGLASHI